MRSAGGDGAAWIVALVALTAGFARLDEAGLQFLDSWCYARVSVEMAASGDPVVPTWGGEPFLEKPPLLFWLTAPLFRLLGPSEFAARALCGAATAGCALLVFRLGRAAAGSACGLAGALLLCATPMFVKWGRTYSTDPLFTLFNLGALACGWRALRAPGAWPAAGALSALAVLTRGAAALPLLGTLGCLPWVGRGGAVGSQRRWILAAAVLFAGLAAPWHLAASRRMGEDFFRVYIGQHTLQRAERNLIDTPRSANPLYYPAHLLRTAWPVLPVLVYGLARMRRGWLPALAPAGLLDRVLLLHAVAQGIFLTLVASRSPRYLLPIYPVLALLAARGLTHGMSEAAGRHLRRWAAAAVLAGSLLVAVWPGRVGTPRGEPFRMLAAGVEREAGAAGRLEVAAELLDPWFVRAFWFYLGRAPLPAAPGSQPQGALLRVEPLESAAACLPPACRVVERAGAYALLGRSGAGE